MRPVFSVTSTLSRSYWEEGLRTSQQSKQSTLPLPLLHIALTKGRERAAKRLLQEYGDIDQQSGSFGNALQAAIAGGKLSLVKAVVDAGANLHILSGTYGSPLAAASVLKTKDPADERHEVLEYLLAQESWGHPSDFLRREGYHGLLKEALRVAARRSCVEVMKLLLKQGATATKSALEAAALGGPIELVNALGGKVNWLLL